MLSGSCNTVYVRYGLGVIQFGQFWFGWVCLVTYGQFFFGVIYKKFNEKVMNLYFLVLTVLLLLYIQLV